MSRSGSSSLNAVRAPSTASCAGCPPYQDTRSEFADPDPEPAPQPARAPANKVTPPAPRKVRRLIGDMVTSIGPGVGQSGPSPVVRTGVLGVAAFGQVVGGAQEPLHEPAVEGLTDFAIGGVVAEVLGLGGIGDEIVEHILAAVIDDEFVTSFDDHPELATLGHAV